VFRSGEAVTDWTPAMGPSRVVSGAFRLSVRHKDGPILVNLALPGDWLGLEALSEDAPAFEVVALTDSAIEAVGAQPLSCAFSREDWLRAACSQMARRSHDMARLRTGAVASRLSVLLGLLGHAPVPPWAQADGDRATANPNPDALRRSLPSLRDMADVVDAKPETVCRTLAQLLPPRSRKGGPRSVAAPTHGPLPAFA
jgi:CRP-like cAMP-binding protein